MRDVNEEGSSPTRVIDLKPGMENVFLKVRVIKTEAPRIIQTKKGERTISNAVIGDESGRVEAVLWGSQAGTLKDGEAVEIKGAWTTSYKGKVQVNIGRSTEVKEIEDGEVPASESIPEASPQAPEEPFRPRGGGRSFQRRPRRGGFRGRE